MNCRKFNNNHHISIFGLYVLINIPNPIQFLLLNPQNLKNFFLKQKEKRQYADEVAFNSQTNFSVYAYVMFV
jgi:hypothetical protein